MVPHNDPIRVFVGATAEQKLAFLTLAHSIRTHTQRAVEIVNLADVVPKAYQSLNDQSATGFSFSRLVIPELCEWSGRAIYLDADMLVFDDIGALWDTPFPEGVALLYSDQPEGLGALSRYAVMVMDCSMLKFDMAAIERALNAGAYTYDELLYDFALVPAQRKSASIPCTWNSLEWFAPGQTKLLHYTKMPYQPWVYPHNPNGRLWYDALKSAMACGDLPADLIRSEIDRGHVYPGVPALVGLDVTGDGRRRWGWLPPALRRSPGHYAGQSRWMAAVRRFVRDGFVLSPWFQGALGKLFPARYRVYADTPPAPRTPAPRNDAGCGA